MEASDEHFHMILATFSGEDYLMNPNDGSKIIQPHWTPMWSNVEILRQISSLQMVISSSTLIIKVIQGIS